MKDKRDECGCHRECIYLSHDCEIPCRWPKCLTSEEHQEVIDSLNESWGEV